MKGQCKEVLELRNLCYSCETGEFFNINLAACEGEVHGISISNTRFKSPFYDLFKGKAVIRSGNIYINGTALAAGNMKRALEQNVYVISLKSYLISSLTLAENLYLVDNKQPLFLPLGKNDLYDKAYEIFRQFGVERLLNPHDYPGSLTPAQKHIVEMLKAYIQGPKVIYMDNITLIYSKSEMELWSRIVRRMADMGRFAVLLALNRGQVPEPDILDRLTIIRSGTTVMELTKSPFEVSQFPPPRDSVFFPKRRGDGDEEAFLSFSHLGGGERLKDISFSIWEGETIGVFDPGVFEGQELMDMLLSRVACIGGLTVNRRHYWLTGEPVPRLPVGVIPYGQDMLFYNFSLFENVVLSLPEKMKRASVRSKRRVTNFLYHNVMKAIHGRDLLELYGKAGRLPKGKVTKEQSVRIQAAKWLFGGAKLMIFVSPESHYDMQNLYKFNLLLEDIRGQGVAALILSENLEFLKKCSERIIQIRDGRIKEYE